MVRILFTIALLFVSLPVRAEDLQWVVENGTVQGCAGKSLPTEPSPGCTGLPFVPLECIQPIAREKILDNRKCAELIGTTFRWLDDQASTCGEFARVSTKGKAAFLLLGHAEKSNCGYHWLKANEESGTCTFTDAGAFQFHPLGNLGLEKLVPEILKLATKEAVPAEIYEKYGTKEIGASLAFKLYEEKEKNAPEKDPYDYLDDTEIQIAFHPKAFDGILEKGFLNLHQTGTSKGTVDPPLRAKVESTLVGHPLDHSTEKMKTVLPKYAYFVPTAARDEEDQRTHRYFGVYGSLLAVLKPEVKDRTTFTATDSLVDYTLKQMQAKPPANAHALRRPSGGSLQARKDDYQENMYWEAQIWGELTVQNDVNYFLWNCFPDRPAEIEYLEKLKATGKPVYECVGEGNDPQNPVRFRRGKQL